MYDINRWGSLTNKGFSKDLCILLKCDKSTNKQADKIQLTICLYLKKKNSGKT